jgi:hypothetical protein
MPDNWGFVLAAYGLAALVLFAYWRRLIRREKELSASMPGHPMTAPASRTPLE